MFSSVLFLTFCRDGLSLLVVPFARVKFIVSESAFPSPFVRGILARKSRRKCRLPLPSSRDGAARFQFNFAKGRRRMRLVARAHVGKRWERRKSDGRSLAFREPKGIRGREEMSPFFPAVFFKLDDGLHLA